MTEEKGGPKPHFRKPVMDEKAAKRSGSESPTPALLKWYLLLT